MISEYFILSWNKPPFWYYLWTAFILQFSFNCISSSLCFSCYCNRWSLAFLCWIYVTFTCMRDSQESMHGWGDYVCISISLLTVFLVSVHSSLYHSCIYVTIIQSRHFLIFNCKAVTWNKIAKSNFILHQKSGAWAVRWRAGRQQAAHIKLLSKVMYYVQQEMGSQFAINNGWFLF